MRQVDHKSVEHYLLSIGQACADYNKARQPATAAFPMGRRGNAWESRRKM